jgi:hypothetical protein
VIFSSIYFEVKNLPRNKNKTKTNKKLKKKEGRVT